MEPAPDTLASTCGRAKPGALERLSSRAWWAERERAGAVGHFHGFGGETTEHRYNLTASVNARNIFNHENLNTPNGALTSPYFLESTGIAGGYGPEATVSNQRRMDIQLRFAF